MHKFQGWLLAVSTTIAVLVNCSTASADPASNAACLEAIQAANEQIEAGRSVEVVNGFYDLSGWYPDHPVGRTIQVVMAMTGEAVTDVMRSNVLLTAISTSIITNCDSVGKVKFGFEASDNVVDYGWIDENTVRAFECVEYDPRREPEPPIRWGQRLCGLGL